MVVRSAQDLGSAPTSFLPTFRCALLWISVCIASSRAANGKSDSGGFPVGFSV